MSERSGSAVLVHTVPLSPIEMRGVVAFDGRAALGRAWRDLNSDLLGMALRRDQVHALDLEAYLVDAPARLRLRLRDSQHSQPRRTKPDKVSLCRTRTWVRVRRLRRNTLRPLEWRPAVSLNRQRGQPLQTRPLFSLRRELFFSSFWQ